MQKLVEAFKNLRFDLREVARYMAVPVQDLKNYITSYDNGEDKDIPEDIRNLFNFIVDYQYLYDKQDIIAMLMSYDNILESSEENPYTKQITLYLKTDNYQEIVDGLTKHGVKPDVSNEGGYASFMIYHDNIEANIHLYNLDGYQYDKHSKQIMPKLREVSYIWNISTILDEIHDIYIKAALRAKAMKKEMDDYEETERFLEENYPVDDSEIDYDNTDLDFLDTEYASSEEQELKKEIISMLQELLNNPFKIVGVECLKSFKYELLNYVDEYEVIYREKLYTVIQNRKTMMCSLCIMSIILDPTAPFDLWEETINIDGHTYYIIKTVNYLQVDKLIKTAKYLESRIAEYIGYLRQDN